MSRDVFTLEEARAILAREGRADQAAILQGGTETPFEVQSITLALDTARLSTDPFPIGFPHRSILIQTATDSSVYVNYRPNTQDSVQSSIKLDLNSSLVFPRSLAKGFLDWPAQAGKSITLIFMVSGELRTGKNVSLQGGTVSIGEGTTCVTSAKASVATGAGAILLAQNANRLVATIQNQGGSSIYVGDSTVTIPTGANPGIEIPPGGYFTWKNAAALYATASAANASIAILTEA